MPVTDLTNTTWLFNEIIDATSCPTAYINFESYGGTYYGIGFLFSGPSLRAGGNTPSPSEPTITGLNYTMEGQDPGLAIGAVVYSYHDAAGSWQWVDETARTIEITGGTDATNSNFIAWLENNATQAVPLPTIVNGIAYMKRTVTPDINNITDLSGTVWVFNETPDVSLDEGFDIDFISNSITFNHMAIDGRGKLDYMNISTNTNIHA